MKGPLFCRSVKALSLAAGLLVATGIVSQVQAADRVVFATTLPQNQSNLFWGGTGERLPNFQALVGHDPVTGKYKNSELAESWSANSDFTEWTFKFKTRCRVSLRLGSGYGGRCHSQL